METKVTTTTIHPSVTLGNWILTMIIMCIPLVNIIMLFIWAFSASSNPSKANWAKANLIIIAIGIVLFLLFGSVFAGILYSFYPHP